MEYALAELATMAIQHDDALNLSFSVASHDKASPYSPTLYAEDDRGRWYS